jgi:hypothetical protein
MNYNKNTIVVEIAGQDSYVALIKYAMLNKNSYLLPTITKVPTQENRYRDFILLFKELQVYIKELGSHLYPPITTDTKNWKRHFTIPAMRQFDYGFTSPCLACHSIIHGIRVELAHSLSKKILTGEKEWHGEFIKLNQNQEVFKLFDKFFKNFDITFIRYELTEKDLENFQSFIKLYDLDYPKFITCSIVDKVLVGNYEELKDYKIIEYFNNEIKHKLTDLILHKKVFWTYL